MPTSPRDRPSGRRNDPADVGLALLEGEFILERELGRGGTSVVWLARDREHGSRVALKLVPPEHREDEDAVARLVREARMLGHLDHPGLPRLEGTRRLGGHHLALVLEFLEGGTLRDRLDEAGPLPVREIRRVVEETARILAYLGSHRIVHRDLKPGNLYLDDRRGRVVLADFGVARHWDADAGLELAEGTHGTPAYMAPEQLAGHPVDGRSDLYALGLVAFEMVAGRLPWAGGGLGALLERRKAEALPPVARLRPGIPPGLARAIDGCLRTDPEARWPDALRLLEALADDRPLTPEERGAGWDLPSPASAPPPAGWEDARTIRYQPGMELPPPPGPGSPPAGPIPPGQETPPRPPTPPRPSTPPPDRPAPERIPSPPRLATRRAPAPAVVLVGLLLALVLGLLIVVL